MSYFIVLLLYPILYRMSRLLVQIFKKIYLVKLLSQYICFSMKGGVKIASRKALKALDEGAFEQERTEC